MVIYLWLIFQSNIITDLVKLQVFDYGTEITTASNNISCLEMRDAKSIPYPMVSATTMLDVIYKPAIEVFPVSTTLVKVSWIS